MREELGASSFLGLVSARQQGAHGELDDAALLCSPWELVEAQLLLGGFLTNLV